VYDPEIGKRTLTVALVSTSGSLRLSYWTVFRVKAVSPGQFDFTDPQAVDSQQRFCLVRAK